MPRQKVDHLDPLAEIRRAMRILRRVERHLLQKNRTQQRLASQRENTFNANQAKLERPTRIELANQI